MRALAILVVLGAAATAHAQYTPAAGENAPAKAYHLSRSADGHVEVVPAPAPVAQAPGEPAPTPTVPRDAHGNAQGNQYDLAIDGAFEGQTVLIIDEVGNTLENTRASLRQKGLASVVFPVGHMPSPAELKSALKKSVEVWLISTSEPELGKEQIALIKEFFDAGHGVYIWGDNEPLYTDANRLAGALVPGLRMEGNLYGDNVVNIAGDKRVGVRAGHLITTGVEHLYEGVTIATIQFAPWQGKNASHVDDGRKGHGPQAGSRAPALPEGFTPLLYGSAGNLVSVAYDKDGKRLVMDGGFTRLAVNWDDAGTARYVKNAAAWLVHAERFKETVAATVGAPH
jgi:hypothetical protein